MSLNTWAFIYGTTGTAIACYWVQQKVFNCQSTTEVIMATFKTRVTKDGEVFTTDATFNWDGVTEEQVRKLAERSVIIATQSLYRAAGRVPATDTIQVAKMLARERGTFKATPESVVAKVNKMTPEQRALILKMLGK
jgi:hypothetical protein